MENAREPRAKGSDRAARAASRTFFPVALLGLALLGALSCAGLAGVPSESARGCWPRFPYRGGWLGGDAAYSVALPGGRSLWLFGDTFVGAPDAMDRSGARLVHNSIGLSACTPDGDFRIDYRWGRAPDGAPRAFLEHETGKWWWMFGGFLHAGRLYLGLLEVEETAPSGPLGMPFRFTGTALARIDDPSEDPRHWQPALLPLSRSDAAFPVSAFVPGDSHLHLFAFVDRGEGRYPRILARLPLDRLTEDGDLGAALETLGSDGSWLPGLVPAQARILMDDTATEMSVRHHAALGKWVALYNYPDVAGTFPETRPSDAVHVRTADALEGPWSQPRLVFRIPELAPDRAPPADPNTGCYAAKEQPQYSRPGSITFTYVCNLFTGPGQDPFAVLRRLQRAMDLYRPVAATVTFP